MNEFGARLTLFRKRQRLSITELAGRAGVDYMQISRYEKGKAVPSLDSALRIARVLGVTVEELATGVAPQ